MAEQRSTWIGYRILPLSTAILAALAMPAAAADFEKRLTLRSDQVLVTNLIGKVRIEGSPGPDFEVELQVQGRDASPERVRIDVHEGSYGEVLVEFPLDESRRYVYPRLGRGTTSFNPTGNESWLGSLFGAGRDSVKVAGSGPGLELWVDATIRVPGGKALKVSHGVGEIVAAGVRGDLDLAIHAGPVAVQRVEGRVIADGGSASLTFEDVQGDVSADTGSGEVTVTRSRGDRVAVDTGSGSVEIQDVEAAKVSVDTGSGSVGATGLGVDELLVDTGSGSVTIELQRMGAGRFVIDTGSGSIDLRLPAAASADIVADTGRGGIRLDLGADHRVLASESDSVHARIGAGAASVRLDTGSGGIRVSQAR
jgi:DUF4097 and DUF4098 domain-containing protein YvlB